MRILPAALVFIFACQTRAETLDESLRKRIGAFPGTVSLYAKNIDSGKSIAIADTALVRTASTIKLPIMMTVFDAVARRKAKWDEPLTVRPVDKVSGSGVLGSEVSDGVQLPLRDVVHLMIVLSDNTATNMILERFSADAVNAYLDSIGIASTRSLRKVRGDGQQLKAATGWSAAGRLPENEKYGLGVSTPRDMVTVLEKLEKGEAVSPDASREMIAILKRCQDTSGIRRRLRGTPVANKTGSLDALRSDVGIVYSSAGRIAIAITVEGIPETDYGPDNAGSVLIADLAKILVDGLARR